MEKLIDNVTKSEQEKVFMECLERYEPMFRKVAMTFAVGADREDLTQEILIRLWKAIPGFRGDAKISTFAYRVAYNCALTWRRGTSRRVHRESALADQMHLDAEASMRERDTEVAKLVEALRELGEVDRSIVSMHLDGLSYGEIGEIVGLRENAVGVRMHRIRKELLKILNKKGTQYE